MRSIIQGLRVGDQKSDYQRDSCVVCNESNVKTVKNKIYSCFKPVNDPISDGVEFVKP